MAQILKKFLYFPSLSSYQAQEDNILNTSIVFVDQPEVKTGGVVTIEAQRFIVTHGKRFDCNFDPSQIEADIQTIYDTIGTGFGTTTGNTIAEKLASVADDLATETTNRENAISSINLSSDGQAITGLVGTTGVLVPTKGDVSATHVTYVYGGTTYTLKDTLDTIKSDITSGIVKVYKGNTVVNTISADGSDYVIKQGSTTVATINIAKDMVVSSGEVITATGNEKKNATESAGLTAGEKYIKLTLNNSDSIIYIPVNSLYKDHTAQANASKIQLSISNDNVISATVVTGSIAETDLTSSVQQKLSRGADATKINAKSTGHVLVTITAASGNNPASATVTESDIASAEYVGTIPAGATSTTVIGYVSEVAGRITVNSITQNNNNIVITGANINVTGYTENTNATSSDVQGTDTVNAALRKLETKVDNTSAGSPLEYVSVANKSIIAKNSNLATNNAYELAIGHYNVSTTGSNASEKTAFSIGNGTSASAKSNAFEVRADGSVWINIADSSGNIDYKLLQDILKNEIDWYEGS